MKRITLLLILSLVFAVTCKKEQKVEKSVSFVDLQDGAEVVSPVKVKLQVTGMQVAPAGEVKEGTGHHHIIIDGPDFIEAGQVIPSDEKNIHLGKGETEVEINLPPGEHTLTAQFADGEHKSYGQPLAKKIKVIVKESKEESKGQEKK
jgi:hypothetical protein